MKIQEAILLQNINDTHKIEKKQNIKFKKRKCINECDFGQQNLLH